ncbi:Cysteine protease atg4 [Actinomortierella ambigua]|nr:Cysteine protease atg4 [Actinomortierella ambigua]
MSAALEASHDPVLNVDSSPATSASSTTALATAQTSSSAASDEIPRALNSSQSTSGKAPETTATTAATTSHVKEQKGRSMEDELRPAACEKADSSSASVDSMHQQGTLRLDGTKESTVSQPTTSLSGVSPATTATSNVSNDTALVSNAEAQETDTAPGAAAPASCTDSPPLSASASRVGSRFSVNLASVGLTQTNGERAVDMAQDLKKNVVNLWNTWFPTPSSTLASVGAGASNSSSPSEPLTSAVPPRSSTFSGSHTLSHHHMQSPRQPVAERPAKTVRMNSTSILSSLGNTLSGSSTDAAASTVSASTESSSTTLSSSSSKHTSRPPNSVSNRSKSPLLLAGLRSSTPHEGQEPNTETASTPPIPQPSLPRSDNPIYLMGKLYPPSPTQWADFQNDFTNGLIWCTYRHSYAPIRPSNFSTDVGWGCMLRSGQSLLSNALAVQFMGRGWTRPSREDPFWDIYVRVISWFFDDMTSRSPFSVHRIALLGKQLGKNIGEWFGPSTTSQVIKALVDNYPDSGLSVYVTTDGVIYKDQVEQTATMKGKSPFGHVLILATIRLGIDKVNPIYHNAIKNLATYHCETIRKIDIGGVDPSMLIAFYCKDRADFDVFCKQVQAMNELLKGDVTTAGQSMSEIVSIGERAPVYDSGDDMEGHLLTVADEEDDELELVL